MEGLKNQQEQRERVNSIVQAYQEKKATIKIPNGEDSNNKEATTNSWQKPSFIF